MKKTNENFKNGTTREMVIAALCLAIALLLPFLTGQIKEIGSMLCPMHLPIFLCGFFCSWRWAATVGFTAPILRSAVFHMPVMMPMAIGMAFELMTYGLVTAILYRILPQKKGSVYLALILGMICGRIVWGIAMIILTGISGGAFTWQAFLGGALLNAVPGIVLQLILVPALVFSLQRAKVA